MIAETVIFQSYANAEKEYIAELYKNSGSSKIVVEAPVKQAASKVEKAPSKNHIVQEIEKAREEIKSTLAGSSVDNKSNKIDELESNFKKVMDMMTQMNIRIQRIESSLNITSGDKVEAKVEEEEDDDVDLFGSDDDEDEEAEKLKQERLKQYADKKAKKQGPIAKSSIVLDVKPWDDETDMKELEILVRSVKEDGLVWGSSKLVPLAYGIKKLQICCVVEDDKVGTDFLEESITAFEDIVQSVDIAAFNKV